MIDVDNDNPRCRSEFLLFELIKRVKREKVHEVYGNTTLSSNTPTPDNPSTFTNVVYTETQTGYGTVLRSVGNEKDKIYVNPKTETAYVERAIGVYEFDGTENWIYYNPVGADHGLSFALTFVGARNANFTSICNYYTYVQDAWSGQNANRIGIYCDHYYAGERFFRKPYENITTNDDFKAWLAERKAAGNPVTVYYVLASKQTEQIPFVE